MIDQAIILAAGLGSRLKPLTNDKPKCLVEVGGMPLIVRHLLMLYEAKVPSITIVTGHMRERVESFVTSRFPNLNIQFCNNTHFDKTNTGYSLGLALEGSPRSFILIDGDLFFEQTLLDLLIASAPENILCLDDVSPLNEEAMKVELSADGARVNRASKKLPLERAAGEYIGLAKFNAEWAAGILSWCRKTPLSQHGSLYYEDGINTLLNSLTPVTCLSTRGLRCVEIDTLEDLERANRYFT